MNQANFQWRPSPFGAFPQRPSVREPVGGLRRATLAGRGLATALLMLATLTIPAAAAPPPDADAPRRAYVTFVQEGPELDGDLSDPVWQLAEPISDFTQVEPVQFGAPSYRTEVRFLSDKDALYISFRGYDPHPDQIVANLMERDAFLFFDDNFTIVLDTFHDKRNGFFFQVNPNAGRRDATFAGNRFEQDWNGIWNAKARIDSKGWVAEIEIPYQTLNFRPGSDIWGLNIARRVRRLNEEDRWADPSVQQLITNMGKAGELIGMAHASQGVGVSLVPAFTVRRIDDPDRDVHKTEFEPSLDAFYNILPSVTASLTVNTDFTEADVDERQINLSRFSLFFPERRDFFLQDSGIFNFGGLRNENGIPFFSRRIGLDAGGKAVPLLVGGKISGRVGRFNLGALDIQQASHGDIDSANLAVARVSANVLEQSTVGLIATNGNPVANDSNSLVGADFNYRSLNLVPGKTVAASFWSQQSITSGESARQGAWGGQISYPNDIIRWRVKFKELQENFNPALGFVNRAGIRRYDGSFRYRIRPQNSVFRTIDQQLTGTLITNRDNEIESGNIFYTPVRLATQIDDVFNIQLVHLYERIEEPFFLLPNIGIREGKYHFPSLITSVRTSRNRKIRLVATVGVGGFYDGWGVRVNPKLEWRPNAHWLIAAELDERHFKGLKAYTRLPDGSLGPVRTTGFTTRVARFRLNIAFTPDLFWNTFVQYDNESDSMSLNSRVQWIVTPGRVVFLVLDQGFHTDDGSFRAGRTVPVIKVGWTFRF
jgi:hypothetical protein